MYLYCLAAAAAAGSYPKDEIEIGTVSANSGPAAVILNVIGHASTNFIDSH